MHILKPKHIKLNPNEAKELLEKYNISVSQLPKIRSTDPGVPQGCQIGEIIKIERKDDDKTYIYYRVIA
ncbi:MAG: DNA-directed RNA polymerase subunit RpoH/Rpb5 C-terminal domain-containing protein [Nanoarchaeota archaeon]